MANEHLSLAASVATAANRLLDVTEAHSNDVKEANAIASESAASLAASAARLEGASDAIPKTLETHVKQSLNGAAEKAAALLASKFTEADKQAKAAASRYEGAVEDYETATKMLRWQVMVPVGLFCLGVSVAVLAFAYFSIQSLIPSNDEIQKRREYILHLDGEISERKGTIQRNDEQIAKLYKKVQALRHQGATVNLVDCENDQQHLCLNILDGQQWVQHIVQEQAE